MDKYVVRIVRTRKGMNDFVRLPYKIYAGNSCYVPDLSKVYLMEPTLVLVPSLLSR